MKIEQGTIYEQVRQHDKIYARTKPSVSFAKTAAAKVDLLERPARADYIGYEKNEAAGRGAVEEFEEKMDGQMDATDRKNQMAILSNTLTPEDYKKAKEAGFSIESAEGGVIVTVTDKIKAQLAKAGVDVSHMGGELTKKQIEEIEGSLAAANQLERCFKEADIPATEENMTEGLEAYQMAEELEPPSKEAIQYILDNRLEPSISNLYMAQSAVNGIAPFDKGDVPDIETLQEQIDRVILDSGNEVSEQTRSDGVWMIKNEIAFTPDNFAYMQKLAGLEFPADGSEIAAAITVAVSEGRRPKDAMLLPEYSLTAKAEHAVAVVTEATDMDLAYLTANNLELTIENLEHAAKLRSQGLLGSEMIETVLQGDSVSEAVEELQISFLTVKRILEETRLAMTTEANRALLKQGISIDTRPLEELVEQLKEQENSYYAALLEEGDTAAEDFAKQLFAKTDQRVSDLKQMPMYTLGMQGYDLDTVEGLYEAGTALQSGQSTLEKAKESYETLMTEPRKDLGDSIQKAFSNIEAILNDLNLEPNAANTRAVKILAYNSLEINEESVLSIKAADERVQRTFANLRPAVVRELIRQGFNPLDMNLDALNQKAESIRTEISDKDTVRFSEYLWKLEQNQGISKEERESFIGIYRLMNQVEKTDGAVIGALVSQGAELTMRNLLTAVRSSKKSGMDYKVDDEFEGISPGESGTKSITDQIQTAYQADCMKDVMETLTPVTMQRLLSEPGWENYTPEQLKEALYAYARETANQEQALETAYASSQLEDLKQAAAADEEIYRFLSRYELPNTVNYILAANRMIHKRNQMFSRMFNSDETFPGEKVDFEGLKEEVLSRFADALESPEEMAAAQEALEETAENVMKTMISGEEHITSMNLRELKLMNAQLAIAGMLVKDEQYTVPVLIGNEVTNVSLKIVRGAKKKGMVEIMFETAKSGKIAACLEAKETGISGFVAVDDREAKKMLESHIQKIAKGFGEEAHDLQVMHVAKLNFSRFSNNFYVESEKEDPQDESYKVQTSRLYKIAKSFIENVKELEF